ncbi:ATP-binding cassette domain-containing protein [Pseudomonas putida]|uniref:ATP-binding cassette domain-containing protein n=1 Tax=Pseudomonas TaxID=286 RepID=UPI00119880C7|nr:ATP-binding cassette domain-containing protein [Pseudomonas putida]EKT4563945.1 ATP-binding cassette domain-containing protein [Pseudomonas putida]MDP9540978.1 ATP-binding cassette domain-containing protein [Pseudomonas putida]QDY37973.1 ABC transporter [Pseudomonas putida]
MDILSTKNLYFGYAGSVLLEDISFNIKKGEIIGILGNNGAGKTTLFDLICKIKKPTKGTISNSSAHQTYLTQILTPPPLLRMNEAGKLITSLTPNFSPNHIEILSKLAKWSPSLSKRYAEISKKKASNCSYGEIRSYFTLTLLLLNSDLIILDEPTAGVDPEFRHYIWLGINHACAEGASVLLSSHYTEEITKNCHRFYMLANKHLEAFESGEQFMDFHGARSLDEAFINASI